jgi:hypothetical protein
MPYQTEFPDFPASDMPAIPAGWQDVSFRNDACPSFSKGVFLLYVNYADPAKREFPETPRFSVHYFEGSHPAICESDNWQEILDAIIDAEI